MHSADDLMKLADEAIHAYAAWLAEFTTGDLQSFHVLRLRNESDDARRKLEAAIRAAVPDGVSVLHGQVEASPDADATNKVKSEGGER